MIKFFNPGLTYKKHRKEFDKEIQKVLAAGDLILRGDVDKFEKKLAKFVGTKYAVALNSGTDALYLALRGVGVKRGDEVLVPSRTFVATAQVVVQLGATPVFYDLDGKLKITPRTKTIIPVHIEGAIDTHFEKILQAVDSHKLFLIEDAAQALGATYNGKKAGSFGVAGCFSFYPAKILGAFGDAGGLTTNNKALYNYVKEARNHFKTNNSDWGINSRLDNLQAVILNIRFQYLNKTLKRREEIAKRYDRELCKIEEIVLPPNTKGRVWQDYTMRLTNRDELYQHLKNQGIETLKNNYPFPVPKLPLAQKYEDETLRLPCNENITNQEIAFVVKNIKNFFKKGG